MLKIWILSFLIFSVKALCPEGSLQWPINKNGSCYFFENDLNGFSSAEVFCAEKGGHLVSIHDAFLNSILAQEAQINFHESTVTDFWIGLTSLMPGEKWTWTDGTTTDFIDWALKEPKNITGTNCATLSLTDGLWRADDCFKSKPFICKIDLIQFLPSTTPKTTTSTTLAPKECPFLWIYFEPTNSCYGDPFYKGPKNWTASEELCLSRNSHLASIHSLEERHFLETLHYMAYDFVWTGAFSNDNGKTWKWSDNTKWDFNPWMTGYPSIKTSAYGKLWGGGLQDDRGSNKYRIVCKKQL